MRHLAWLNATPKPPPGSKRAKFAEPDSPPLSRMDQLRQSGITPPLPPNPAPHIIDRLIEIGLTEAAGMGAAPVSWQSIDAFQRNTGFILAPWEARLIRRLSSDYLTTSRKAESENCPPPWRGPVTERERETEESRLRLVLG